MNNLNRQPIHRIIAHYMELIRISHTVFALPFAGLSAAWALLLPSYNWRWSSALTGLLGILICMVTARSAAMAFNRWVDAEFDSHNPRTASRHIPAGLLSPRQVLLFFLLSSFLFLVGTLLFLPNWLPLVLAIPVLAWLCGYSYAKRFTWGAHLWLGTALALSPVCAWVALRGEQVIARPSEMLAAWLMSAAIACWVSGFDIIYACQDIDFDLQAGLHSMPVRFGLNGALRIASGLHLLMWGILMLIPTAAPELKLGWLYYLSLSIVAVLLIRQHWIVTAQDLSRVNEAFFTLNALISLGFTTTAALDSWLK